MRARRALPAVAAGLVLLAAGCVAAARRPAPTTGTLAVPGGELAYEVAGAGPAVVLVHGGLVDRRLWDDQLADLARDHRVVRYDLRGFGRSSLPAGSFSHVEDLDRLLRHLGVERPTLVGLSLGGMIALDFALEYPERVRALVAVGSGLRGYQPAPDSTIAALYRAVATDPERAVRLWMDSTAMAPRAPSEGRERMRRMLADNLRGWSSIDPRQVRWPGEPTLGRLGQVRVPTLVMVGDQDAPDLLRIADSLAMKIPGARRVTLAGGSHHPNLDNPAEFNRELRRFLRSVEGRDCTREAGTNRC